MRIKLVIMILVILFVTILYLKNGIAHFICSCDKEEGFTTDQSDRYTIPDDFDHFDRYLYNDHVQHVRKIIKYLEIPESRAKLKEVYALGDSSIEAVITSARQLTGELSEKDPLLPGKGVVMRAAQQSTAGVPQEETSAFVPTKKWQFFHFFKILLNFGYGGKTSKAVDDGMLTADVTNWGDNAKCKLEMFSYALDNPIENQTDQSLSESIDSVFQRCDRAKKERLRREDTTNMLDIGPGVPLTPTAPVPAGGPPARAGGRPGCTKLCTKPPADCAELDGYLARGGCAEKCSEIEASALRAFMSCQNTQPLASWPPKDAITEMPPRLPLTNSNPMDIPIIGDGIVTDSTTSSLRTFTPSANINLNNSGIISAGNPVSANTADQPLKPPDTPTLPVPLASNVESTVGINKIFTQLAKNSNKSSETPKPTGFDAIAKKCLDHKTLDKYFLKTAMSPPTDMSQYIKKSAMKKYVFDQSKYILKSEMKPSRNFLDPSKYVLKTQMKPNSQLPTQSQNPYDNTAGGPLDMTMDYGLYPVKTRFNTCSYNELETSGKSGESDKINDYDPNRLSQCKVNKNRPNIFD